MRLIHHWVVRSSTKESPSNCDNSSCAGNFTIYHFILIIIYKVLISSPISTLYYASISVSMNSCPHCKASLY